MNSFQIAYDDASYEADAAVVAAAAGEFETAIPHVRSAFDAVRSSPDAPRVATVRDRGVAALEALGTGVGDRGDAVAALTAFRTAVEECHPASPGERARFR